VDPNAGENDWETNKKHGDDSAGQLNLLLQDAGSLELGPLELTDSELGQLSEEEEQHAREKYKQFRAEEDAEVKAAAHEEEAAAKFEAGLGCANTDNGAKDSGGDGCATYVPVAKAVKEWCGVYDDADFKSKEMCCSCGGGNKASRRAPMGATNSVPGGATKTEACSTYSYYNCPMSTCELSGPKGECAAKATVDNWKAPTGATKVNWMPPGHENRGPVTEAPTTGATKTEAPTSGGDGGGAPCVFPFIVEWKSAMGTTTYSSCTSDGDDQPWCATEYQVGTTVMGKWGYCNCNQAGTAAFSIGDRVTWTGSDNDVPSGTIGVVTSLDLTRLDGLTVSVKFSAGTWPFKPTDLVKAPCIDKHDQCRRMETHGGCTHRDTRAWMATYCPKTCSKCS